MVFAREQRLALQHLGKDAACAPDVDLDIVLLPREHDLGCSVVPCRDIARHLGILYTRKSKVANLEIAVLVDQNVARLQVAVDHTGGVDIFQSALEESAEPCQPGFATYQNLVQEILDELFLEGSRGEQTVEIGAQEFGDEVADESVWGSGTWGRHIHVFQGGDEDVAQADDLPPVSTAIPQCQLWYAHILVSQVLQQL